MQDLQTINEFIEGLESEEPTLKNCTQLASLYIVRKHLENLKSDEVEDEISEILPSYRIYADIKTRYCNGEVTEEIVLSSLKSLCSEIQDLICIIYANTNMLKERKEVYKMLSYLYEKCV